MKAQPRKPGPNSSTTPAEQATTTWAEHVLNVRMYKDVRGVAYLGTCSCGEELTETRQAPHHCLGAWHRHMEEVGVLKQPLPWQRGSHGRG